MIIGIPFETRPGETRVAVTPANIQSWSDTSVKFLLQSGSGVKAGFSDDEVMAMAADGSAICGDEG